MKTKIFFLIPLICLGFNLKSYADDDLVDCGTSGLCKVVDAPAIVINYKIPDPAYAGTQVDLTITHRSQAWMWVNDEDLLSQIVGFDNSPNGMSVNWNQEYVVPDKKIEVSPDIGEVHNRLTISAKFNVFGWRIYPTQLNVSEAGDSFTFETPLKIDIRKQGICVGDATYRVGVYWDYYGGGYWQNC